MRGLQIFDDEYLEKSRKLSTDEILEFLEEFRRLLPESVYIELREQRIAEWNSNVKANEGSGREIGPQ